MKKLKTPLQKYQKRFWIATTVALIALSLLTYVVSSNFNYIAGKYMLSHFYIYTDAIDESIKERLDIDSDGKYFKHLDNLALDLLADELYKYSNDKYTYLYTPAKYTKYQENKEEKAQTSYIEVLDDNTVYLYLSNFSPFSKDIVVENIETLQSRKNIIIDLRKNSGGDIDVMVDLSDLFLEKNKIIAVDKMKLYSRTYKSKNDPDLLYDNIYILQSTRSASASENLIAALDYNLDNITLVGEKTFGKGIGQFTIELKDNYAFKATSLKWMAPDGVTNINKVGIEPDIEYLEEDIVDFVLNQIG